MSLSYIQKLNHSEWCTRCNKITERQEIISLTVDMIECVECHSVSDFYDKTEGYEGVGG